MLESIKPTPNEPTIAVLEELLELARRGEVVGLAAAVQHYDSTQSFIWSGHCFDAPLHAAGLVRLLEHEILERERSFTDPG